MGRLAHQILPGVAGNTYVNIVPCGGAASHASATPLVVKQFAFDPVLYDLEGSTRTLIFRAIAGNGVNPLTTHVQLFSVTDAEIIATLDFVDTTTPVKDEAILTEGAGAGEIDLAEKIYEVRIFVDAPGGPSDTIELGSAEIRVLTTPIG
jgi:hypothetical protein